MRPYLPNRPYRPYLAGAAGGLSARATVLNVQSIRVSFSQCVDITAVAGIQVNIGGSGWEAVASVSGGSAKVWEFSTTTVIAEGDVVLWQYLGAEDSIVDCTESVDIGVLGPITVNNPLELTAPEIVSAQIGTVLDGTNDVLVLALDEAVTANDFADGWTVKEGANTLTVTAATHPSAAVVHLTIDERIEIGQTITVSYNDAIGSIVDVSGFPTPNALASVTDEAVTNDVVLVSLGITPDAPTIEAGDTQQFTATGTYNNSGTLDITDAVTWDSSNDSFATIAADGLATGVAEGSVTISATLGTISDTTSLTVEESAVTLVSLAITPDAGTIDYGATQQFTATGTYSDASTADITGDVTWDSSDDALATITVGGLATGTGVGTATISATLGAVSGDTTLAVAWTPALLFLAGEKGLWIDPSDFSTLSETFDGGAGNVAVGDPIGRAEDKSGTDAHATQSTEANRFILRQTGDLYYMEVDGINDGMVTPSVDFSATDEMTICVGLRKLSDAALGSIVELSASVASNAGTFYLNNGSATAGAARYTTISRGSASSGATLAAVSAASFTSPITNVVTGLHDISADLSQIRVNGAASGTDGTADKGTGNFGNYPIYIGRRGGATLPLSGHIYGIIVRNKLTAGADLAAMEAWMNAKTGAY